MHTIENEGRHRVRWLGIALIGIGIGAMLCVMWMTGRFGWSLQDAESDRWVSAIVHVLGDAAGAGLVACGSVMLGRRGWKWRAMAALAMLCALLLVAYSIL